MFDAAKLLGQLIDHTTSPAASGRLSGALAQSGPAGAIGAPQSPAAGSVPATGGDSGGLGSLLSLLASQAQQALGTARQEVQSNNPLAIGGLGALAGSLLGGGKGAIGGGLLAALGSVAFSALQNSGQAAQAATASAAPLGANPGANPLGLDTQEDVQSTATLLLRAMINAAKADGQIDQKEMERILGKLQEVGSDASARDFVISEMGKPLDLNGLVAAVKSPHQAVQVYAASLLAIDVDTPAETKYLAQLAQALKLGPEVVGQINGAMGVKV
jgi:uncharacterized membrane protein YebE (DUF533 family)